MTTGSPKSKRPSIQDKRVNSLKNMEVPKSTRNVLKDLPDDWKPTIVKFESDDDLGDAAAAATANRRHVAASSSPSKGGILCCCSAPFGALMRRNLLYRKRNFLATLLEILLPIAFAAILVGIKEAVVKDGDTGEKELVDAVIYNDTDAMTILSFSDYVTAILAVRQCFALGGKFLISGIPATPYAGTGGWQVPFVKCDTRMCQENGQDAYDFCAYPFLAVAPSTPDDVGGLARALLFKEYVLSRYPQLLNTNLTHFPRDGYEFVRLFNSSSAIDQYVKNVEYGTSGNEEIAVAVIFEGDDPSNFMYSLRINSTNFNSPELEKRPGATTAPNTEIQFATYAKEDNACPVSDDAEQGIYQNSCTGRYMYNGFLTTQRLVHDFIMMESGAKQTGNFVSEYGVRYVQFPIRAYEKEGTIQELAAFMPLLMVLGILFSCTSMISYVVQEKELRQKELLKMMGVTELEIGWSWFLSLWIWHILTATLVTVVFAQLFTNSNFVFLFIFWQLCFLGFTVMSLLVSSFVSKATRGVLIGLLSIFVGYFLTLAVNVETGSTALISLLSLHPVTAMSYAIQEIGRLEGLGVGLQSSSITSTDAPSGYTFASAYGNLFLSNIFMGILTWYLNRVIVPDYGQALPWYFPFTSSYWCPNSTVAHSEGKANDTVAAHDVNIPIEPVSDACKQQTRDGESIEIKNLRKDFGEKVAVDGLNLSMFSGQVTALLGHNGAGKTTTISMLTGALSPSEGTATICGNDIRTDLAKIRGNIGICLQHDCLFPKLTVREHVQFFSRVKGVYGKMSYADAEAGIDQTIRDVALEEKSNTFSMNLSGGMKRKLSLAMAFCGGSKVVFLDEPTSGMDPFSRRFSWNVIRQYRQGRCIVLTTHFMDEADILGDRIAIMAEGRLRCCGSSLFLKKTYGVGYQLTIEKQRKRKGECGPDGGIVDDSSIDDDIKEIVTGAVKDAVVLSNVGTEMSFQLPLGASDRMVSMFAGLEEQQHNGRITTYGVSITTLDEVFLLVARGDDHAKEDFKSSHFSSKNLANSPAGDEDDDTDRSVKSKMDLENEGLFGTHVQALIRKRAANFKRDKKAWCCTTILPSVFVLFGLLLLKFVVPDQNLSPMPLNMDDYNIDVVQGPRNPIAFNSPGSTFSCNPGQCTTNMASIDTFMAQTNESYSFCGGPSLADINASCSIEESESIIVNIVGDGASGNPGQVESITESSDFLLEQSKNVFQASQYGAVFFNHEMNSTTGSGELYGPSVAKVCFENASGYLGDSQCELYGAGIGYTIAYNFTAIHAAPIFQVVADEAIVRKALNRGAFNIIATNQPLPITYKEEKYAEASSATSLWFLIVLSFPFILGAFATFVVAERESKAKHLQTVAGVTPSAYWVATLIWDSTNYLIPSIIIVILAFAFDVPAITSTARGMLDGFLALLFLFGPAAAGFTYCVSFGFKSPSFANVFLIVSGFLISMGASMTVFILRLIGQNPFDYRENLVLAAQIVEWICRFFPTFCLGKGLLFAFNIDFLELLYGKQLNAFDPEVMLYEVIFLAFECVAYTALAIFLDRLSGNPEFMLLVQRVFCCRQPSENSAIADTPDDNDVIAEQERILKGEANEDAIVISELTKVYPNGKVAVNRLSLGIAPGEVFGLLGINGAGKTTTLGMLTAEFPPTSGDATLAGFSLRHEPEKTRRRIGYCPQFDAHFQHMTGREHVELYAAIKGIPSASVKEAAAEKLAQVGLSEEDSDRLSSHYSGGMKRRLSLACATIGQPQLVFLDECSTGVDPVARREIWQMVSDLVSAEVPGAPKTSVILTTHSMDECEALCPRIGIMANGKLRCLGSAQHLKTKFGRGYQVELKVDAVGKDDDDFKTNLVALARSKGIASDEEAVSADAEVFFTLQEAKNALQQLTEDIYLSSKLNVANPTGYGVFKDASSPTGVLLNVLTSFASNELRMRELQSFVSKTYPTSVLRERQDTKARYEISSENVSIAQVFASIEDNKGRLRLSDYGVSQTSLEQVFNMHAAEAEKLKQGRMDS